LPAASRPLVAAPEAAPAPRRPSASHRVSVAQPDSVPETDHSEPDGDLEAVEPRPKRRRHRSPTSRRPDTAEAQDLYDDEVRTLASLFCEAEASAAAQVLQADSPARSQASAEVEAHGAAPPLLAPPAEVTESEPENHTPTSQADAHPDGTPLEETPPYDLRYKWSLSAKRRRVQRQRQDLANAVRLAKSQEEMANKKAEERAATERASAEMARKMAEDKKVAEAASALVEMAKKMAEKSAAAERASAEMARKMAEEKKVAEAASAEMADSQAEDSQLQRLIAEERAKAERLAMSREDMPERKAEEMVAAERASLDMANMANEKATAEVKSGNAAVSIISLKIKIGIKIRKPAGAEIGIKIRKPAGEMIVHSVTPGGLMAMWNESHPDKAVQAGDIILKVRGSSKCAKTFEEMMDRSRKLVLKVSRRLKSAPPKPAMQLEPEEPVRSKTHGKAEPTVMADSLVGAMTQNLLSQPVEQVNTKEVAVNKSHTRATSPLQDDYQEKAESALPAAASLEEPPVVRSPGRGIARPLAQASKEPRTLAEVAIPAALSRASSGSKLRLRAATGAVSGSVTQPGSFIRPVAAHTRVY